MALSCQLHSYVGFMSLSWQFHGAFTYKPYLGTVCQNLLEKLSKSRCWLSIWFFFLISASFLAICQIHVGFMGLSWRFLPSDFYCFSKQFHGACMALSWQIHGAFMALSWHFTGTFPFGHVWICHENAMKVP